MISLPERRCTWQLPFSTRRYHFVTLRYKICDVTLDVSRRRLHERAIGNFQALRERTNPSGGSHRRLFERVIINFQALTDIANHWGNWLEDI